MKYVVCLCLTFFLFLKTSWFQENKAIIVYGSDTCHYCMETKAYLKEKKVDFIYFDVDVNLEKQQEMLIKLQKAKISIETLTLPVIDKRGELFTNGEDFEAFLKRITK
ncbi:glutaredoxin [Flavobacteriaceae bacterium XHP0103]|uniref:glutaredoxin family protein n=1 Tax=Marixanthotalea marina TaxID=2844359 RepID=UPI00298A080E|nr:glutaredoxin [Marixanthotalea marina]MBU3820915.1 glutaredoxin [Marixanthotalea marina]